MPLPGERYRTAADIGGCREHYIRFGGKSKMKQYIGSKIVQAESAWKITDDEGSSIQAKSAHGCCKNGSTIEDGYKVVYEDGYESWSPKEVFEAAYRQTDGMSFGLALEAAKKGMRIARAGWNGKGMYVFLAEEVELYTYADLSEFEDTGVHILDCLCMRTADRSICPGWLASQSDMLADDWMIVE
jgi:hypothetical protein